MKILVCIKQVPDMESGFRLNAEGTWYDDRDLAYRMNEYDEYAVEQAVQLKEQLGGQADISVLSVGPARVSEALKKALAMGADRGVHIQDDLAWQRDPWQIASLIAAFAAGKGFDLVLTGMQSQDRGSAQVGPLLAELLGCACVTTVIGFALEGDTATVRRELEGGLKAVVRFKLPGVVTCQLGLNTPRYPTLPNIMKAKKKELLVIPVQDLLTTEAVAVTTSFYPPAKKGSGLVLEGDVATLVDQVIGILKEKTAVLR
jgi:electron transfer flavoprotein beta subunit